MCQSPLARGVGARPTLAGSIAFHVISVYALNKQPRFMTANGSCRPKHRIRHSQLCLTAPEVRRTHAKTNTEPACEVHHVANNCRARIASRQRSKLVGYSAMCTQTALPRQILKAWSPYTYVCVCVHCLAALEDIQRAWRPTAGVTSSSTCVGAECRC